MTKVCSTICDGGYFRAFNGVRSSAGRHSHATGDVPDCLNFYTNDTYLNEIRKSSSSPVSCRDMELIFFFQSITKKGKVLFGILWDVPVKPLSYMINDRYSFGG